MTKLIQIEKKEYEALLAAKKRDAKKKKQYSEELEAGNILFFPECPFDFPEEERSFLLGQKQTGATYRKNISYKPQAGKITNFVPKSKEEAERLLEVMRNYSERALSCLATLFPSYVKHWRVDYASFRPIEEKGRQLRTHARNDLLHTDAFPSRPMHGNRILRFFTNINPTDPRHWVTTEPFQDLVKKYGGDKGVPFPGDGRKEKLQSMFKLLGKRLGLPIPLRSPYDRFMLQFHDYLKDNQEFQKNCPKSHWDFPPNCCWIVFTDQVSHSVTGGKYAMEQTVIVPKKALVKPEWAPVSVLEKLSKRKMINPLFAK